MTVVVRNVAEMDFVVRQWADDRAPQRDPTRLSCFRAEIRNLALASLRISGKLDIWMIPKS